VGLIGGAWGLAAALYGLLFGKLHSFIFLTKKIALLIFDPL
jgi:hypothetical protein